MTTATKTAAKAPKTATKTRKAATKAPKVAAPKTATKTRKAATKAPKFYPLVPVVEAPKAAAKVESPKAEAVTYDTVAAYYGFLTAPKTAAKVEAPKAEAPKFYPLVPVAAAEFKAEGVTVTVVEPSAAKAEGSKGKGVSAARVAAVKKSWCDEKVRAARSARYFFTATNTATNDVFVSDDLFASQSYDNIMKNLRAFADKGGIISATNISARANLKAEDNAALTVNIPNRRRRLVTGELSEERITFLYNGSEVTVSVKLVA